MMYLRCQGTTAAADGGGSALLQTRMGDLKKMPQSTKKLNTLNIIRVKLHKNKHLDVNVYSCILSYFFKNYLLLKSQILQKNSI